MNVVLIAVCVLFFDYLTKWWIRTHFYLGESHALISQVFHITYIENRGAAFGILENQQWIFLGVVSIFILALYLYRKKIACFPTYASLGIGMLLGGAIGNGIDRFIKQSVTDFFDFRIWPIFNIADIAICFGMTLLVLYLWKEERK